MVEERAIFLPFAYDVFLWFGSWGWFCRRTQCW